jgi:hypothetical protein
MWLYAPTLCNAAVTNGWIHRLEYVSLFVMGFAFWWPILGPWSRQRLSPLAGIVYLLSACLGCTILGIILMFAPLEDCSMYLHPINGLGILPLIQNRWGLPGLIFAFIGLHLWLVLPTPQTSRLGKLTRSWRSCNHVNSSDAEHPNKRNQPRPPSRKKCGCSR